MEDSRQDLRTEFRGSDGVVGFGRIWPCISGGGKMEDGRNADFAPHSSVLIPQSSFLASLPPGAGLLVLQFHRPRQE